MIVLDASAAVELLLNTPASVRVAERIADPSLSLHAPHLLAIEVSQVLRRFTSTGAISAEIAEECLFDLQGLDLARYAHEPFLPRMWQLRGNLTAYDAIYVALAETLRAPLLTFDERLARAPGHDAVIEVLAS
jgi:predicted nucleic acid-binding protein